MHSFSHTPYTGQSQPERRVLNYAIFRMGCRRRSLLAYLVFIFILPRVSAFSCISLPRSYPRSSPHPSLLLCYFTLSLYPPLPASTDRLVYNPRVCGLNTGALMFPIIPLSSSEIPGLS